MDLDLVRAGLGVVLEGRGAERALDRPGVSVRVHVEAQRLLRGEAWK